jgi:hypothetical protein
MKKVWTVVAIVTIVSFVLSILIPSYVYKPRIDSLILENNHMEDELRVKEQEIAEKDGIIEEKNSLIEEKNDELSESQGKIAELDEEYNICKELALSQNKTIEELQQEIEILQSHQPEITADPVAYVTFDELTDWVREKFSSDWLVGTSHKDPHPLVNLAVLEDFLRQVPKSTCRHMTDDMTFRLERLWEKAGLPGFSMNSIKIEDAFWLNLFVTKEQGKLVGYKVVAYTGEITPMTQEDYDSVSYAVLLSDSGRL